MSTRNRLLVICLGVTTLALVGGGVLVATGAFRSRDDSTVDAATATSNPAASPDKTGWLSSGPNFVVYLQFSEFDDQISGSAQIARLDTTSTTSTAGESYVVAKVNSTPTALSGTRKDSLVTLNVGLAAPWSGTISESTLTLNITQDDGSLAPVVFAPASVADFNEALSSLQASAGATNAETQTQIQRQQTQDNAVVAMRQLASAVETLDSHTASLKSQTYEGTLSSYQSDIGQLEQTLREMGTADCRDLDSYAGDADSELGNIKANDGNMSVIDNTIRMGVDGLKSDIASLQATLADAQRAAAAAGEPPPEPQPVNAAITSANQQISTSNTEMTTAHGQAVAYANQAQDLNSQAHAYATLHGC